VFNQVSVKSYLRVLNLFKYYKLFFATLHIRDFDIRKQKRAFEPSTTRNTAFLNLIYFQFNAIYSQKYVFIYLYLLCSRQRDAKKYTVRYFPHLHLWRYRIDHVIISRQKFVFKMATLVQEQRTNFCLCLKKKSIL
jgi:hypothetical protein